MCIRGNRIIVDITEFIFSRIISQLTWKSRKTQFKLHYLLRGFCHEKIKWKISFFQSREKAKSWSNYVRRKHILPGGNMLSLSRMRADARSLMMYWRRTYLNTERKGAPSSVFKKGSFSHRSVLAIVSNVIKQLPTKEIRLPMRISVWWDVAMMYLFYVYKARHQHQPEAAWLGRPTTGWAAETSTAEREHCKESS